ncbi:UNVERIFIED_CONTAM: Disease resistance protein RPP13 [Sesamum radiatum]|uniref:Disease resistance protein RPP13 n=1 Tax=Sesamum radiatum TaxID=300843 RepID=A0AAW2MV84_SESRA
MSNMEESEMRLKYRLMGGGSELEVIPIVGMGGIGNYLSKTLFGRRYLIVLDDIWYTKSWDDIGRFLPDNKNGSRIIITTRESHVADHIGSGVLHHKMYLLKDDESWNLIHQKVFAPGETCSPGLESVGRKIAEKCSGLPLAISVIGGLLSQAERTQVFWEQVAEDVSLTIADNDGQILSKSLEEAADMYLMDLVDRNLIVIQQQRPEWYVKSYGIHDLLRDLGLKKAYDENFLFVQRPYLPGEVHSRRVCVHSIEDIDSELNQMPLARSFLLTGAGSPEILSPGISAAKLLRVLDVLEIEFHWFPKEILQLINLRYLALSISELPSSISGLWNLQILIVQAIEFSSGPLAVMPEISDMMHLRHIKFKGFYVWYDDKYREHFVVQDQLQSLSTIAISQLTDRILQTIPSLEKLGIFCDEELDHVRDFSRIHKLHTLKCTSLKYDSGNLLSNLVFPHSLKKLTLRDCGILDPDMNTIGSLPLLQILKLQGSNESHFPILQHLVIRRCLDLEVIRLATGEIPTLQVIEVDNCRSSVIDSAKMIEEEQLELGNAGLEVRFGTTWLKRRP